MVKILETRENGSQGTKLVKNETLITNSNKNQNQTHQKLVVWSTEAEKRGDPHIQNPNITISCKLKAQILTKTKSELRIVFLIARGSRGM